MPTNNRDLLGSRHERKPRIRWDVLRASTSGTPIHPQIHEALLKAIEHKNFITVTLRTHAEASGEPHIYGERAGQPTLLLYNDEAEPKWRMIDAKQVEQVRIWLDEHFRKRELPAEFDPDEEHLGSPKE